MNWYLSFFFLFFSYIVGAIPIGYIVASWFGVPDIRAHGSGNIGATNVARILGLRFFAPIFLLDVVKGFLNMWMLQSFGCSQFFVVCAACAHLIGNGCSIFLRGHGGKGVSASVGLMMAVFPLALPVVTFVWVTVLFFTKTVGIASVLSVVLLPIIVYILDASLHIFLLSLFVAGWVLARHRNNIMSFVKLQE